jgi:excisionase family DNA binding protein
VLYTLKEIADILKLDYMTIWTMVRDGRIKAIKMGYAWRISQDELDRIMKEGIHE